MSEQVKDTSEIEAPDWLGHEVFVESFSFISGNSSVPWMKARDAFIGRLGFDAENSRYFLTDEGGDEVTSIAYVYRVEDDAPRNGPRRLFLDGWFVEDGKNDWGTWTIEKDEASKQE